MLISALAKRKNQIQSSLTWNVLLSETHFRTQRTERPFRYADKRFFDNADSGIFIMENCWMVKINLNILERWLFEHYGELFQLNDDYWHICKES